MEAYHKRCEGAAVGLPFFSGALRQSRKTILRKPGTQEADRIHKIGALPRIAAGLALSVIRLRQGYGVTGRLSGGF
jgi:hypothetical protein